MAPPTTYSGHFDATSLIVVVCAALAGSNAVELILLILTTFHTYHGLYFWSLVIATIGIIPYVVGMVVMYFHPSATLPGLIVNNVGWITMIVGQSTVLYSRLGIVLGNQQSRILVFTKWMIVIDAIVFYTLATVVVFGMHYSSNDSFAHGYIYVERLQMTGFCIQEFVISGLYIWKTLDILQAGEKKQAFRTLWQLLSINIVIVALDVALLVLEYLGLGSIEIAFKALAYSVKLKLEFAILGKLVESSSFAQRKMSVSLGNTITLEEDRPSVQVAAVSATPHFTTPALSPWPDEEKSGRAEHAEYQSCESTRTTSHQTEENSEAHLHKPNLGRTRSSEIERRSLDTYHDMIRFISTS